MSNKYHVLVRNSVPATYWNAHFGWGPLQSATQYSDSVFSIAQYPKGTDGVAAVTDGVIDGLLNLGQIAERTSTAPESALEAMTKIAYGADKAQSRKRNAQTGEPFYTASLVVHLQGDTAKSVRQHRPSFAHDCMLNWFSEYAACPETQVTELLASGDFGCTHRLDWGEAAGAGLERTRISSRSAGRGLNS